MHKKHTMADMSTRKHYPGKHLVSIIVNGEEKARCAFFLANTCNSPENM